MPAGKRLAKLSVSFVQSNEWRNVNPDGSGLMQNKGRQTRGVFDHRWHQGNLDFVGGVPWRTSFELHTRNRNSRG